MTDKKRTAEIVVHQYEDGELVSTDTVQATGFSVITETGGTLNIFTNFLPVMLPYVLMLFEAKIRNMLGIVPQMKPVPDAPKKSNIVSVPPGSQLPN